ncbi:hypothetical protein FRC08_018371 [Ceratobasidium sp. 394]|nr:hypothetical protein FRC08_018371 [Ceratobasidium sp. 394]
MVHPRAFPNLPVFDKAAAFVPFSPEVIAECKDYTPILPALHELAQATNEYETVGPPTGEDGYYGRSRDAPSLYNLPKQPVSHEEFSVFLDAEFEDVFWDLRKEEHRRYGPVPLAEQFTSLPFTDRATGVQFGGPNGVTLGVAIFIKAAHWVKRAEAETFSGRVMPTSLINAYLGPQVVELNCLLAQCIATLGETAHSQERSQMKFPDFAATVSFKESSAQPPLPRVAANDPPEPKRREQRIITQVQYVQNTLSPSAVSPGVNTAMAAMDTGNDSTTRDTDSRASSVGSKRPLKGTPARSPATGTLPLTAVQDSPPMDPVLPPKRVKAAHAPMRVTKAGNAPTSPITMVHDSESDKPTILTTDDRIAHLVGDDASSTMSEQTQSHAAAQPAGGKKVPDRIRPKVKTVSPVEHETTRGRQQMRAVSVPRSKSRGRSAGPSGSGGNAPFVPPLAFNALLDEIYQTVDNAPSELAPAGPRRTTRQKTEVVRGDASQAQSTRGGKKGAGRGK